MGESVGEIGLDLVVNEGSFKRQMAGINSLAKKAGVALAAAFSVKKLIDFGKECLELGSDLAEVQNVVDVTFPSMTAQVDKFAKSAMTSFGLSETMAKQYTGTFGAMAKAFGFTEQAAYDMSTTLTGLAGDVASFYNISQDEAYTKLKSVFSGETETLKDLGVVMTQNALDAYALANGYGKTTAKMSELEKVSLRYAFVQDQLTAATGDFARTSDSWANQVRIMKLQMQSFMATVGQGLINIFTPVIKVINVVIGKLMTLANAFKAFTELVMGKKSAGAQVTGTGKQATDSLNSAAGAASNLADSTTGAGKAAKKAAKEMRSLMGFDTVNKLDSNSDSDTDSGNSSGSGGATGGGISGADLGTGALSEMDSATSAFAEKMAGYFEKIKKAIEPTTTALKNLWDNGLAKLGTFTWNVLKDFYEHFLLPVGKWVLGKGLPEFINTLNDGLMKIDFNKINDSLKKLWDALTPFAINVGEGLLWFWQNVLVPLGTWTMNEVVPRFLDTLSSAITILNSVIDALKPLFQWFWDKVLEPLAKWAADTFLNAWDAINDVLKKFSDWCSENPDTIRTITEVVGAFFLAWKVTELLAFIEQSGGVIGTLKLIKDALIGTTAAKIADKAETIALTAMYAKDFVVNLAKGTAELIKQAAQFAINTARKIVDTAAQIAQTAATVAWNAVCAIATAVTTALGAAFTFLTSPIGLVIIAIGLLVAAGVMLYKHWDEISAKAKEIWESIKKVISEKIEAAKQKITIVVTAIKAFWSTTWDAIKQKVSDIWDSVKALISARIMLIKSTINAVLSAIKAIWNQSWNAIKQKVSGIWGSIKSLISTRINVIKNTISAVLSAIKTVWSQSWNAMKTTVTNIFQGIWSTIKGIINSILGGIEKMANGVVSGINAVIRALNNLSFTTPDWLPDGLGGKTLGFNIGEMSGVSLPRLAQGGYVKPNTPQLAMIGDNKHQGEVVAPEDKLEEMAMQAVKNASVAGGITRDELEKIINNAVMRIVSALYSMGFNINGEQLAKVEKMIQTGIDRRFNTAEIV
jgi:hypothetical protein|nr:MAG TPA: minor tail protein [Caudoviricetes sp.]